MAASSCSTSAIPRAERGAGNRGPGGIRKLGAAGLVLLGTDLAFYTGKGFLHWQGDLRARRATPRHRHPHPPRREPNPPHTPRRQMMKFKPGGHQTHAFWCASLSIGLGPGPAAVRATPDPPGLPHLNSPGRPAAMPFTREQSVHLKQSTGEPGSIRQADHASQQQDHNGSAPPRIHAKAAAPLRRPNRS